MQQAKQRHRNQQQGHPLGGRQRNGLAGWRVGKIRLSTYERALPTSIACQTPVHALRCRWLQSGTQRRVGLREVEGCEVDRIRTWRLGWRCQRIDTYRLEQGASATGGPAALGTAKVFRPRDALATCNRRPRADRCPEHATWDRSALGISDGQAGATQWRTSDGISTA